MEKKTVLQNVKNVVVANENIQTRTVSNFYRVWYVNHIQQP